MIRIDPSSFDAPLVPVRPVLRSAHYGWLTLALGTLTIYGALIPFHFKPQSLDEALVSFRNIAFASPGDVEARGDWNITLVQFTALSFVLMGTLCVDRSRAQALRTAPVICLLCAFLSLVIEFVQIYFPPRTVSVNDLIIQAAGGCIGVVAWIVGGQRITKWVRRLNSATGVAGLAARLWPGYLVMLAIVQLMPFDFTISSTELAAKYQESKIWLVPFASHVSLGLGAILAKFFVHTICFGPLGFLRALAPDRALRGRTNWPGILAFGLLVTCIVEGLQLFVYSRVCDVSDIIIGTAAILLGWCAGRLFREYWQEYLTKPELRLTPNWHPAVWAGLTLTWLAIVLYFHWTPFDFTTDPARFAGDTENFAQHGLRRFSWFPLVDYYWGNKYNALDQFIKKSLAFLPLGALICLSRKKLYQPGMTWIVLGAALASGIIIEAGRYFLPARIPSSTDLLISCFGAWLGFLMMQHVRVVFWAERTLSGFAPHVHQASVAAKT